MKAGLAKVFIQEILGIPKEKRAENIGPLTKAAFEQLEDTDNAAEWPVAPLPEGTGPRRINQEGLDLVKHFEGFYPTAYKDPVGVWTIFWGHTGLQHRDGTVYPGRSGTREEGERLLRYDMNQFERRVETFVKVPLTDNQFAALVSFDFNTGGLGRSTLLKKLNAGDYTGAANEFLKWIRGGGRVLPGLVRRRKSERNLFLGIKPSIVR
jgi:GH24 family phage-related lysozyme (muramidase)